MNDPYSLQPKDPVAGKTVAEILGEIVWLMTQDPIGREMKVAEIEALVMPAILEKRFHIQYIAINNERMPVAVTIGENLSFMVAPHKEINS